MKALKESVSLEVDLENSVHSHSHSADSHVDELNPLMGSAALGEKENKYKHVRPLSPTPVDSTHSMESHSIIQPLKGSSWLFLNHPTQTFTSRQLCDYIEMIVLRHVHHTNEVTHTHHQHMQTPIRPIRDTLQKLRNLLITEPEHMTHFELHVIDDEKAINNNTKATNKISALPKIYPTNSERERHAIISKKNLNSTTQNKIGEEHEPKLISTKSIKWATHSSRDLGRKNLRFLPSSALLHHPLYSIDVDAYCGLLRGSVRQDWNTIETDDDEERNWEELKPHWFELFFDLMFVAAIVHISSEVAEAYEHAEYIFILTVFPQFGLLILCWLEQSLYHSRFRMTQAGDGFLRFIYMAFVLMMGLSIGNSNYQTSQKLFLIAYMFTKLIMCIMFIKSSLIERATNHSIYMIVENVSSIAAVIFIEILVHIEGNEFEERPWIWTVIYSVLFIYSWFHMAVLIYLQCIRDFGINMPINVPHIAERMGAFVLIILGETIISMMSQHIESTRNGILTTYTVTMSLFVIVYCIGKLYFESQPSEHELHHHQKSHAMSTSVWRARIYKWFHILLFFGLLGLGLGSKITVHELQYYHGDKPIYVFLPGISCIVICICINIIRLTHPFDYSEKHPHLVIAVWIVRVLCVIVMFAILFTWNIVNHFLILGIYVACFIVQIFVDFEAQQRQIITKTVAKNKSLHFYKSPRGTLHCTDRDSIDTTRDISFIGTF